MVLNEIMEKLSERSDWQYSEYGKDKSVIIVPLDGNRFQAVLAQVRSDNGRQGFQFISKICAFNNDIDLKELLLNNINFYYAKFIIENDIIRLIASTYADRADEKLLMEMILEVATRADEWEHKLTGLDVN